MLPSQLGAVNWMQKDVSFLFFVAKFVPMFCKYPNDHLVVMVMSTPTFITYTSEYKLEEYKNE